jgi:hypothetical protein
MITNTDLKGTAMPGPIVAEVGQSPTTFEFDIAHHLPGRLRLRSAVLKGNARACERAQHHLAQIGGVKQASANPITGSVLLGYDPNRLSPGEVTEVLAAHGYVLRAIEAETEAGDWWADRVASAVMDWVVNALAERLAVAMIAALA